MFLVMQLASNCLFRNSIHSDKLPVNGRGSFNRSLDHSRNHIEN